MIRRTALLTLSVITACAGYVIQRPEGVSPVPPVIQVAAPAGRSWDAALGWFLENNIPVKGADRAAGLIVAEMAGIPFRNQTPLLEMKNPPMVAIYADCGSRNERPYDPTSTAFNVRIAGDSTTSSVAVSARYTESGEGVGNSFFVCKSTGKWERDVQNYIKSHAELAK